VPASGSNRAFLFLFARSFIIGVVKFDVPLWKSKLAFAHLVKIHQDVERKTLHSSQLSSHPAAHRLLL
jgi:hypothetical protein